MARRTLTRSLLLGTLLFTSLFLFREPLRDTAFSILRFPFTVVRTTVMTALLLPRVPSLVREHEVLQRELLQARLELSQLREAARQSGRLQALQQQLSSMHGITASVIGHSTVPTQQTLLIDQGASQGLVPGGTVVELEGVVGRVIDVQRHTALIELLTDPESRVAAVIARTREFGLLVGRGDGQCNLVYLDAGADVQVNDQVLTAGVGGTFPKGMMLGRVTQVTRDETAGSSTATVRPSVHLNRVEEVLYLPPASIGGGAG